MNPLPRDKGLDKTLEFALDGYQFISKRCALYQTDIFQTRLLMQNTICMRGEEAARLFYDNDRFIRKNAAPNRLVATLFGHGAVQTLDGAAHHHRKEMFLSLMSPAGIERLKEITQQQWQQYALKWEKRSQIVLLDETLELLCRSVCAWAAIPLPEERVRDTTRDFVALIESAAKTGPYHWAGRRARQRLEDWIAELIAQARTDQRNAQSGDALNTVAWHRDADGKLLDSRLAAAELINVLRPTVGVAWYYVWIALALHSYPEYRVRLGGTEPNFSQWFIQEVRRFYPFFPGVVARVRTGFEWNGFYFPKDTRTILDIYGTNHDPKAWNTPQQFMPERFRDWNGSPFSFIPQGGGPYQEGHRCPGEWITIELMKQAVDFLLHKIQYQVPKQDLDINFSRIPTAPNSRFVMKNVQLVRDKTR